MTSLAAPKSPRYWTPAQDALLLTTSDDDEAAALLGRSPRAVKLRRWQVVSGRARHGWHTGAPANTIHDVWKYVDKGGEDECWPYIGAKRRRGYGAFAVAFKTHPAHRIAFWAATGINPGELMVCHRCDNPPCCNPAHLFLGTHTENVHDMLAKGRANPPRGERHHGAKLTAEQVREIRTRRAAGETLVDLGREFGVGGARLSVIVNHPGKAWSHV